MCYSRAAGVRVSKEVKMKGLSLFDDGPRAVAESAAMDSEGIYMNSARPWKIRRVLDIASACLEPAVLRVRLHTIPG